MIRKIGGPVLALFAVWLALAPGVPRGLLAAYRDQFAMVVWVLIGLAAGLLIWQIYRQHWERVLAWVLRSGD